MCTYTPGESQFSQRHHWQVSAHDHAYYDALVDSAAMAIDAERIAARDPEAFRPKRQLAGSFHQWIDQTFMEEEAARAIQAFVRTKMPPNAAIDKNNFSYNTASTFSITSHEDEDDEAHLQYDVFLWHGSSLGLDFYSCNITGFPCVEDANGNDSLPGMWNLRTGDYLISINDYSTHHEVMPFESVVQILEDGVRPAVLRFRRPRIQEMRRSNRSRLSLSRSMSLSKKEQQRRRERLERSLCYVVWREEDGPLGIVLKPDRNKPYPTVSEVNAAGVVARETQRNSVCAGDLLLSINHMDVSVIGYRKSLDIMKFAPRPLVLTFRRSSAEHSGTRSLEL